MNMIRNMGPLYFCTDESSVVLNTGSVCRPQLCWNLIVSSEAKTTRLMWFSLQYCCILKLFSKTLWASYLDSILSHMWGPDVQVIPKTKI